LLKLRKYERIMGKNGEFNNTAEQLKVSVQLSNKYFYSFFFPLVNNFIVVNCEKWKNCVGSG
jgi:hypothetical protein